MRKEIEVMSFEQFLINFKTEKMSSEAVKDLVLGARTLKPHLQALMFCAFVLRVPDKKIQEFYPEMIINYFKTQFRAMILRGAEKNRKEKKAKFTLINTKTKIE